MKSYKLPSGSYRVQKMYKGKSISVTFDHKPSDKEIIAALAERMSNGEEAKKGSFKHYAEEYIKNRSAILSPSSIRTYNIQIKYLSDWFLSMNINDITQEIIQKEINDFSVDHAPKTTRSLHGFISAVISSIRPSMVIHTTLPKLARKTRYMPSSKDIENILAAAKNTDYSIGFQLGVLSLRRGEVCALDLSDLKGNELTVSKTLVYNNHQWIVKNTPKTDASYRTIYLPDSLVEEITKKGSFFDLSPKKLNEALHRYQDQLGIPHFRFHDLRRYFASYVSTIIPESDAMALGGWKSDYVYKQIYRDSLEENRKASSIMIANSILTN